jgi:SAM-dependent methyltransferase
VKQEISSNDKATQVYWNSLWSKRILLKSASPYKRGPLNHTDIRFHMLFEKWLSGFEGASLLELGCAGSQWLPYFSEEYNLSVSGLDYSKLGCEHARIILKQKGVYGTIVEGDLFDPPLFMTNFFDMVVSFGLVEHFEDTVKCLVACSRFLKLGGLIITIIPNMPGCTGSLQKVFDRKVYDMHVPLDRKILRQSHINAGLDVLFCDYFLFFRIITNFSRMQLNHPLLWRFLKIPIFVFNVIGWLGESVFNFNKPIPWLSPYIVCVSHKKL